MWTVIGQTSTAQGLQGAIIARFTWTLIFEAAASSKNGHCRPIHRGKDSLRLHTSEALYSQLLYKTKRREKSYVNRVGKATANTVPVFAAQW